MAIFDQNPAVSGVGEWYKDKVTALEATRLSGEIEIRWNALIGGLGPESPDGTTVDEKKQADEPSEICVRAICKDDQRCTSQAEFCGSKKNFHSNEVLHRLSFDGFRLAYGSWMTRKVGLLYHGQRVWPSNESIAVVTCKFWYQYRISSTSNIYN